MAESNINKKKYMVFDLVKILREHTDRLHPMKQKELVDRLHEAGYSTDRSTVRRTITDLVLDPESRIRSVSNTAHDEKDSDYETYYSGLYYDQEFSDAELRWLIDGILYSRNVPHEARKDLLEKLCNLGNAHFRRNLNLNKIRRLAADEPVNPELFENIDRVGRAIDSGRKISVVYNNMGTDFTLHPRWNSAHLLNPYAMVIRNGFYYLICNNDHHTTLTVYRMDRMTDVQIEEKLPVRPVRELDGFHEGWNLQEFMEHNANMAFGDPERITFDCAEKGVPIVIDAFGKGASFRAKKDGQYECTVRVPAFDMKLFALQHSEFVRVTSPEELAEEIRGELRTALDKYSEESSNDNKTAGPGGTAAERVQYYEAKLDRALKALDAFEQELPDVEELERYYASPEWKEDFAADEAGQFPKDLKRGVLSEDGIYNLLERIREITGGPR